MGGPGSGAHLVKIRLIGFRSLVLIPFFETRCILNRRDGGGRRTDPERDGTDGTDPKRTESNGTLIQGHEIDENLL